MKIVNAYIENYRLLQSFNLDLEDKLSLVIGKNNCGKTSLLSVLEKFLSSDAHQAEFAFDDFNIEFQQQIKAFVETDHLQELPDPFGIVLKLYIQYEESDDLSNISQLMLDLDPDVNKIILSFEYSLSTEKLMLLRSDYAIFKASLNSVTKAEQENEIIAEPPVATALADLEAIVDAEAIVAEVITETETLKKIPFIT
jgi:putative ATP-dependent endonuclease of OLD family